MDNAKFGRGRSRRLAVVAGALAIGCIGVQGTANASPSVPSPASPSLSSVSPVLDPGSAAGSLPWVHATPTSRIAPLTYRKTELTPREVERAVGQRQTVCRRSNTNKNRLIVQMVGYCSPAQVSAYVLGITGAEIAPNHRAMRREMNTVTDATILSSKYNASRRSGRVVITTSVELTLQNDDGTSSVKPAILLAVGRYQGRRSVVSFVFVLTDIVGGTAKGALARAEKVSVVLARRYGVSV